MGTDCLAAALRSWDLLALGAYFAACAALVVWPMLKTRSTEGYFFAGRSMPGWAVGLSVLGTSISSVTFLAYPGSAFQGNWSRLGPGLALVPAAVIAVAIIVPFYRRTLFSSAYEFYERRFGTTWARSYGSVLFTLISAWRVGLILYLLTIPIQTMTGWRYETTIVIVGAFTTLYTMSGGIEAVIWTQVMQILVLISGGLACILVVFVKVSGGPAEVLSIAWDHGKFGLNLNLDFNLAKDTFWVLFLSGLFGNLHEFATHQTRIQRYCAAKTLRDARNSIWLGGLGCIPVWITFMFVGSCLFAFYQAFPQRLQSGLRADEVFPRFILTEIPAGVGGFVIAAVLASAMSAIASSLNGASSTITSDLYQRHLITGRSDRHYLFAAKGITLAFGVVMMTIAYILTNADQSTILDVAFIVGGILMGGLSGLFYLGFFTTRANNFGLIWGAITAMFIIVLMTVWTLFEEKTLFGWNVPIMPVSKFLIGAVSVVAAAVVGYAASFLAPAPDRTLLAGITWWTRHEPQANPPSQPTGFQVEPASSR
jgi:solute:Na+ symporter, SSS family